MKKIFLISCSGLFLLMGLAQAKEYPRYAEMTGKLEFTNPYWEGLIKDGYYYQLILKEPFLPHGFPERQRRKEWDGKRWVPLPSEGAIIEPNVQYSINLKFSKKLMETAKASIGKVVTVYGLLNCPFSCYMEVEKMELAE